MIINLPSYVNDLHTKFNPDLSKHTVAHYYGSLSACRIVEIDTDNLNPIWRSLREKLNSVDAQGQPNGVSYGHVEGVLKVVKGSLRKHGLLQWVRDYDHNLLISELNAFHKQVDPFSEADLKKMFVATFRDKPLWNVLILTVYSGLRIGALERLKFSDFQEVAGYPVYVFPVFSKGKPYDGVISKSMFQHLKSNACSDQNRYPENGFVVPRKDSQKTPFEQLCRMRLKRALEQSRDCVGIMKGKSPFHSCRHFFSQKIAQTPGLGVIDLALLMGHNMPSTTALKIYTDRKDLHERLAKAYMMTPFPTLDLLPTAQAIYVLPPTQ